MKCPFCAHLESKVTDSRAGTSGDVIRQVNGQPIARHILQNDDVIEIANMQIRYRNYKAVDSPSFDRTMIIQASATKEGSAPDQPVGVYSLATAKKELRIKKGGRLGLVRVFSGTQQPSRDVELTQVLQTFGIPGKQVAVINSRPQGYFITHVEGSTFPVVNGRQLDAQAHRLNDHDIIEIAGVKMEFFLHGGEA